MTKQKTKKPEEIEEYEPEETEEPEEIPEEIKGMNYDNILSEYTNNDNDYSAILYKIINGKKTFVYQYENEIPHPVFELQQKYNGGTFRIYIKDGITKKLVKSADVHVLPPAETVREDKPSQSRMDILQELKTMSEIVGGNSQGSGNNSNDVLMKIMEMQNKQSRELMQMQIESEKRMTELFMKLQTKKSDVSDFIEIYNVIDNLKGNTENSSPVEKLLSSPLIMPLLEKLTGNSSSVPGQTALPAPVSVKEVYKPSVNDWIIKLNESPEGKKWIDTITPELAEKKINFLLTKNKDVLDIETATNIILTILKNKEGEKANGKPETM
jgi:hypothetical protein